MPTGGAGPSLFEYGGAMMTDSQKWLLLAGAGVCAWLLYLLAPVLTPFLMAALFAYLGDPLVDRLQRLRLSRTMAVVVVFVVMILLSLLVLLLLVPQLEKQVAYLINKTPQMIDWLQHRAIPWLSDFLGIELMTVDMAMIKGLLTEHWRTTGGIVASIVSMVSSSGLALAGVLVSIVLVPVVLFYLLRDWDELLAHIADLIPRRYSVVVAKLARDADEMLGAFLRGQLLVMISLGVIYTFGLWLVGLKLALLVGALAGLVSFVPYLGFIVGIVAATVAMLAQTPELVPLILVWIVFGVGQLLEGMVLTPWLVGDRIGLHPVVVIFAVLAGGQLFGFFGVLLALPVAAVAAVLLRYMHMRYTGSTLYDQNNH